ncbi:cobalamin B12-binding domain-containing protein [Desulfomonile tiedjei]|uniref:Putative cobalamin binding protein n=1 Tax=Desulfomonile tiedjei (strain ATCC 49306 / DSM 6799 / DCB-1) TaxID=706587 RepID=I4C0T6_DESTA|nr:corrinoid protein [Desulfomonile tiedjei]AFM23177.1 putative cobalamin binding protein [Desulfomonile tiedjei DSM 6799]
MMGDLAQALANLEEKKVYELIDKQIAEGINPLDIVQECNDGMIRVGELFSEQKYFISQLIYSAEILKQVMKKLDPLLAGVQTTGGGSGKVIIGTVKGDIHDIGKNIVITLLKGSGFDVIDLGVDVPTEKFVEAVKESGAKVLGLSALLNFTYPVMKDVVDAVSAAGLRDRVKIIVGGTPVNEQVREYSGADYYAVDAVAGVRICKEVYA